MTFWVHLPSFSCWRARVGLEIVVPPREGRHSRSRWGEVHLPSYFSKFYHPPGCLSMEPKAAQAPCLWLHSSSPRPERNIVSIYFPPFLKIIFFICIEGILYILCLFIVQKLDSLMPVTLSSLCVYVFEMGFPRSKFRVLNILLCINDRSILLTYFRYFSVFPWTVHRLTKTQTWLKRLGTHTHTRMWKSASQLLSPLQPPTLSIWESWVCFLGLWGLFLFCKWIQFCPIENASSCGYHVKHVFLHL